MPEAEDNLDFLKDVLDDYLVETGELVEQLETDLVTLESRPADTDLLNQIFRAVHTIKGTSSFLGFEHMAELTHRAEDVLNLLRRGEKAVDDRVMDALLQVVDWIRRLLEHIRQEGNDGDYDLSGVLGALAKLADQPSDQVQEKGGGAPASPGNELARERSDSVQDPTDGAVGDAGTDTRATTEGEAAAPDGKEGKTREPESAQSQEAPELVGTAQPGTNASETRGLGRQAKSRPSAGGEKGPQTVRVPVERLDEMMDLVGELVLARNRLMQVAAELTQGRRGNDPGLLAGGIEQLEAASEQIHFVTAQLQEAVMRTRMLPIANAFKRFPRMVRDLARESGKEVDLILEGGETELDKSLLELIADPLVHLVRNAVDHGIEPPDEREKRGKPRKGTVVLSAAQEGNHVLVSISDDGRGIDPERVRAVALEKGLVSQEEARGLSGRDLYNLIFLPGFSTAKRVTGTSGRGVGMDVVKTNITRLSGQIEVESEVGKGTRFLVRLPLTLAITPALLAKVAGEILVIPLASVLETARLRDFSLVTIQGQRAMRLRESVLPLVDLAQVLELRQEPFGLDGYAVIIGLANRRAGLVVDDLLGQEEIVIKPLGQYLGKMPALAGATILGDGKVRMVLDVGGVLELARKTAPDEHLLETATADPAAKPVAEVV